MVSMSYREKMKTAVCDDEKEAVQYLANLLDRNELIESVRMFTDQEEFLQEVRNGELFDVVFMDIDWKNEIDGILLSSQLFEMVPATQIIYVTGYNDRFSQQIFLEKSNLCGYLVKPVQKEILDKLLLKAEANTRSAEEKLVVRQNGMIHAIAIKDICYLESNGHHVMIHTLDEKLEIYGKLEAIKAKLPKCFLQCHKSYIINMNHIRYIDKNVILMRGERRINISRNKYSEVREQYFHYMGEQI